MIQEKGAKWSRVQLQRFTVRRNGTPLLRRKRTAGFGFSTFSRSRHHHTIYARVKRDAMIQENRRLFRTITVDNRPEFHGYKEIEGVTIYFANPYASWERGTNENTNGLIRQYIPKRTSMKTLTPERCTNIARALNNRPRKRHGFRTPLEVLSEHLNRAVHLLLSALRFKLELKAYKRKAGGAGAPSHEAGRVGCCAELDGAPSRRKERLPSCDCQRHILGRFSVVRRARLSSSTLRDHLCDASSCKSDYGDDRTCEELGDWPHRRTTAGVGHDVLGDQEVDKKAGPRQQRTEQKTFIGRKDRTGRCTKGHRRYDQN